MSATGTYLCYGIQLAGFYPELTSFNLTPYKLNKDQKFTTVFQRRTRTTISRCECMLDYVYTNADDVLAIVKMLIVGVNAEHQHLDVRISNEEFGMEELWKKYGRIDHTEPQLYSRI